MYPNILNPTYSDLSTLISWTQPIVICVPWYHGPNLYWTVYPDILNPTYTAWSMYPNILNPTYSDLCTLISWTQPILICVPWNHGPNLYWTVYPDILNPTYTDLCTLISWTQPILHDLCILISWNQPILICVPWYHGPSLYWSMYPDILKPTYINLCTLISWTQPILIYVS